MGEHKLSYLLTINTQVSRPSQWCQSRIIEIINKIS